MRTILPRRVLLGLAMVLGLPALAQAQLFPNLPLHKRQKPDCSQENPQYRIIRQEYWGYYPTCWRKFPSGWGCPSPEVADWEASKATIKFRIPETLEPATRGDDEGPDDRLNPQPRDNPPGRPNNLDIPPIGPDDRSPFDPAPARPGAGRSTSEPDGPVPPVDAPRASRSTSPNSVDDVQRTAGQAPARRRTIVAGLFGGRRR